MRFGVNSARGRLYDRTEKAIDPITTYILQTQACRSDRPRRWYMLQRLDGDFSASGSSRSLNSDLCTRNVSLEIKQVRQQETVKEEGKGEYKTFTYIGAGGSRTTTSSRCQFSKRPISRSRRRMLSDSTFRAGPPARRAALRTSAPASNGCYVYGAPN
ncbi:hypothetical protein EVAR_92975_1 [Eumeta japonica]|uniref:Uncharacterized protein n=1 Tax=Eumeta variegata TaxID=151549 RepID=A0A4C1TBD4_EUMVA|nr:hypothetical protein EVAR_92975_1 [Eumeta japonica]